MTSAPKSHGPKAAHAPRRAPSKTPPAKSAPRPPTANASSAVESSSRAAGPAQGDRASVRVYRQGLGDCILIRVKRTSGDDFKLLIDCGVVLGTPNAGDIMTRVVENLVKDTDQKVDAIAITHEHWDHVSGFTQAKDSFKKLKTDEVWVAWTEDKDDELAKTLRSELGKAAEALTASATALRATGDSETVQMLADIALTPLGVVGASGSTSAALDSVKSMGKVRICRPSDKPIEIESANARFYVLGPPHDPTLIRKINPSTKNPETYGLAMNGAGALSLGVLAALASRGEAADDPSSIPSPVDGSPFHQRMTIPLGPKGRPVVGDSHSFDPDARKAWQNIDDFFQKKYAGSDGADDWRRIDGDWLGSATELALALQSYTNNTSLVLALELGDPGKGDVLLFAGDAQVGNWESWQSWECQLDGGKLTGPDLLRRTIFYKVGHHGSHNATLKGHGVEEMAALRTAIIPVDEEEAKKKRWGSMPLPELLDALEKKVPGMVLRTDKKPDKLPDNIAMGDNYFEVHL
jgi:Metallo-beta-lactamase superfamily